MKIFLIRHGETVDNVAGIYAGVRDSQLTNHGVEQTKRLGDYLASTQVKFSHIFASPLTRAFQTANAIYERQVKQWQHDAETGLAPDIVKVPDLIEQDFGFYEGKSFQARSSPRKQGRETHVEKHRNDLGFVDVETKESMARRADSFLSEYLLPLTTTDDGESEHVIAIVSHGMLLSTLWRRMLLKMSRGTLSIVPEVTAARGPVVLEHLGGWSNTGYLELALHKNDGGSSVPNNQVSSPVNASPESSNPPLRTERPPTPPAISPPTFKDYTVRILAIDSKTHLIGLKRQRGGIGRLAHDTNQRKLDSFFKKPKIG